MWFSLPATPLILTEFPCFCRSLQGFADHESWANFFLPNHVTTLGCRPRRGNMSRYVTSTRRHAGFSLFELMVVISVGFILAAMSIPRMNNIIARMKLRSSMTTASGFFQNLRMLAVKNNTLMKSDHANRATAPYSLVYWAKDSTDTTPLSTHDAQVEMQAPIYAWDTPTGAGAPSAIPNSTLGLLSNPETTDPLFNS